MCAATCKSGSVFFVQKAKLYGRVFVHFEIPTKKTNKKIKQKTQLPENQIVAFEFCGAGGIRTRVRTKRRNAFYMLSF